MSNSDVSGDAAATKDALFINRIILRGPEMHLLHRHLLSAGPATRDALIDRFVPLSAVDRPSPAETLNLALDGLSTLQLVEEVEGPNGGRVFQAKALPNGQSFPLAILYGLRSAGQRQQAILDLYGWCIQNGVTQVDPESLLNTARKHVQSEATWTLEKIRFWTNLCTFIGVVLPIKGGVMIAPTKTFLRQLIRERTGTSEAWAAELFSQIHEQCVPCLTQVGNLHDGWAATLDVLQQHGIARLERGSDAPALLHAALSRGTAWSRITLTPVSIDDEVAVP
jgi:hypothetical protein